MLHLPFLVFWSPWCYDRLAYVKCGADWLPSFCKPFFTFEVAVICPEYMKRSERGGALIRSLFQAYHENLGYGDSMWTSHCGVIEGVDLRGGGGIRLWDIVRWDIMIWDDGEAEVILRDGWGWRVGGTRLSALGVTELLWEGPHAPDETFR